MNSQTPAPRRFALPKWVSSLIEAHPSITSLVERRQAELVSAISFVLGISVIIGFVVSARNNGLSLDLIPLALFGVLGFIVYFISRTPRYNFARLLLVFGVSVLAYFLGASAVYLSLVLFLALAVSFILNGLLDLRWMILLWVLNVLALFLLTPIIFPQVQGQEAFIMRVGSTAVGIFLILFTWHRNTLERLRLDEIEEASQELARANAELDVNRAELARQFASLQLVTEVSRAVSQVRALDELLDDAVEILRQRFNLYYVQVYLANSTQAELNLQSGTGDVGAQLRQRSHRLPMDVTSINGRAAIEKRTVVVADTVKSPTFRPNPLLPGTRSEMAIPLLLGDQVVGVLDLQSDQPNALTPQSASSFETLAGQLAITIQNARLLQQTQEARAQLESQARRQSSRNWSDYLDAIYKPERVAYLFDGKDLSALPAEEQPAPPEEENRLHAPLQVGGEALGEISVTVSPENQTPQNQELLHIIAGRVSQHLESLRLVENAERYRHEAEEATRRLALEGWREYFQNAAAPSLHYIYDTQKVTATEALPELPPNTFTTPIRLHEESLGSISILGMYQPSPETKELIETITQRLADHLENLRLSEQTRSRARREQALRQITSAVRGAISAETILRTAAREIGSLLGRNTAIFLAQQTPAQENAPTGE